MAKKKLVVFSGAGVSADSGLSTFRDSDGLWENYRIEDVCTAEAWIKNPALVLDFYNQRRKGAMAAKPNPAHIAIARAQEYFNVEVITQNVDDLHERAGSRSVVHLHGELVKCRSSQNESLIYDVQGWEMKMGQLCELGTQLRPHIVFFGESVPIYEKALEIVRTADILLIIGTSLNVYPAAGLIHYTPKVSPIYVVDPKVDNIMVDNPVFYTKKCAAEGVVQVIDKLILESV